MRLIFFTGQLEVLDFFSYRLCEAAKAYGDECYTVSFGRPETFQSEAFQTFLKQPDCVAFLFDQIGLLLQDKDGANTWDRLEIPVYSMLVDHPRYFNDTLPHPIKMQRLICIDRDHIDFIRKYYHFEQPIHFMPCGGEIYLPEKNGQATPFRDRPMDVLYCGSCQPENSAYPAIEWMSDNGQAFYQRVIGVMLNDPSSATEHVIEAFLEANQLSCNEEQRLQLVVECARPIEETVRRYYKLQLMQALDRARISVDVYGEHWEQQGYSYGDTVRIHPRVSSAECNRMTQDAKIALNIMPWYKKGCSERVFNNMLNGALCVTDPSAYLLERFTDGQELIYYEPQSPEECAEKIADALQRPDAASAIAKRGFDAAVANDTWARRYETIRNFILKDKSL